MRIIAFYIIGILFLTSCLQTQDKKKTDELAIERDTITQPSIQSDYENNRAVHIIIRDQEVVFI